MTSLLMAFPLFSHAHRVNNGFIQMTTVATCHQDIPPNMLISPTYNATVYKLGEKEMILSVEAVGAETQNILNQILKVRDDIKPLLPALFLQSDDGTINFSLNLSLPQDNPANLSIPFAPYSIQFKCTLK